MSKTALLILLAIVAPNVAVADVVRHDVIPEPYRVAWAATGSDRFVFELSANTYANGDASCAVNWVSETAGADAPIYVAQLRCSGHSQRAGAPFASNLIIWPKSSDEIASGPDFLRLRVFCHCRVMADAPAAHSCTGHNVTGIVGNPFALSGIRKRICATSRHWCRANASLVSARTAGFSVKSTQNWIKFNSAADPLGLLCADESSAGAESRVNDDVTTAAEIERRILKHPGRPDGRVVLRAEIRRVNVLSEGCWLVTP